MPNDETPLLRCAEGNFILKMYHKWIPEKSKWKAAYDKGLNVNLNLNDNVLYLGASSGSTISFISKYTNGIIFSVEKSPKMIIQLIKKSIKIKNIFPLFCDARNIDYIGSKLKNTKINILFQDIPSFDQVEILINASKLIDNDCKIFFSLKTKSISQVDSYDIYKLVKEKLTNFFEIIEETSLEPYHKFHWFFILKKK